MVNSIALLTNKYKGKFWCKDSSTVKNVVNIIVNTVYLNNPVHNYSGKTPQNVIYTAIK